jgi:hypothetical protein
LKKLTLLISLLIISVTVKAQYNYAEWGVGGGLGTVKPYSDLKQNDAQKGLYFNLVYNYSPYLPFAFELQTGKLSGGNNVTDASHRYFVNEYFALNLHGDLQLGEITDYEGNFLLQRLKGLYMGTGFGAMFNNITDIRRYALDDPNYIFPGKAHSISILVPFRVGYEFKIYNYNDEPFMGINLTYTHNFTFSEGLDGYDDSSSKFKNNAQDMFRVITVGVKFNFGSTASYIKSIK